ncbi:MAG: transcription antitermination factor NusB [Rhodobacteraceae bacterium]|nr:transcription antitermination factor NusB [Paracoccaceae bacterium]
MSGENRKSAARLYAVQALFQMEAADSALDDIVPEFLTHRFGARDDGRDWVEGHIGLFRVLIKQAVNHQARIDQATDDALVDRWPIDRIDPTLRAIFRAAGAELLTGEAPRKVVISEYIEITKDFFPQGKEPGFANAILDAMARRLSP